jgi:hypothetical protein
VHLLIPSSALMAASGEQSVRRRARRIQPLVLGSVLPMDEGGTCDSCGDGDVQVIAVRRIYLTPEAWDQEEKVEVLEAVERWCFPCRSSYPHQVV